MHDSRNPALDMGLCIIITVTRTKEPLIESQARNTIHQSWFKAPLGEKRRRKKKQLSLLKFTKIRYRKAFPTRERENVGPSNEMGPLL